MTTTPAIPEGFQPHFRRSPLTDPWEPIFSQRTEAAVAIGLRLAGAHTNSRGFAHGGLITALADNAMGLSCGTQLQGVSGLVTVSLSIDFVGSARVGQWLEVRPRVIKVGSAICFAECLVTADEALCARANATFAYRRAKA